MEQASQVPFPVTKASWTDWFRTNEDSFFVTMQRGATKERREMNRRLRAVQTACVAAQRVVAGSEHTGGGGASGCGSMGAEGCMGADDTSGDCAHGDGACGVAGCGSMGAVGAADCGGGAKGCGCMDAVGAADCGGVAKGCGCI